MLNFIFTDWLDSDVCVGRGESHCVWPTSPQSFEPTHLPVNLQPTHRPVNVEPSHLHVNYELLHLPVNF